MSKIILLLLLFSFVSLKETKEDYLKATKHCQVNDPLIQSAAAKLKKSSELETAKNIFPWHCVLNTRIIIYVVAQKNIGMFLYPTICKAKIITFRASNVLEAEFSN